MNFAFYANTNKQMVSLLQWFNNNKTSADLIDALKVKKITYWDLFGFSLKIYSNLKILNLIIKATWGANHTSIMKKYVKTQLDSI